MGVWPVCFMLVIVLSWNNESLSINGAEVLKDSQNVGTVLFDKDSLTDHCWTNEEFIVLSSRKMFQDLLPRIDYLNIHSDEYVAGLLNYFDICLQKVSDSAMGKTRHLMLRAVTDVMGGYLYSYMTPIMKVSYYAGKIRYRNVKTIFLLLEQIKDFLRTDGLGWKKPIEIEMFINVTPIAVAPEPGNSACDKLILKYPIPAQINKNPREQRDLNSNKSHNFTTDDKTSEDKTVPIVFLPYFDNDKQPNSIALPFKDHTLWSLNDEASIEILTKYYETSYNCITSLDDSKKMLKQFDHDFYLWLIRTVYPHLSDNKWYPALGGVLRIIVFLKKKVKIHNDPTNTKTLLSLDTVEEKRMGTLQLITTAVVTAIVVWLLAAGLLMCWKCYQSRRTEKYTSCDSLDFKSSSTRSKTLYCTDSTCPCPNPKISYSQLKNRDMVDKANSEPCRQKGGAGSRSGRLSTVHESQMEKTYINHKKKRRKNYRSTSDSPSYTSSSPQTHYINKKFHYSSDLSSTSSEDFDR